MGLPVCLSDIRRRSVYGHNDHDKILPCDCGDSYGNEKNAFLRGAFMEDCIGFNNGKGLAEACQVSFAADHTNCLAIYPAFYEMKQHLPTRSVEITHLGLNSIQAQDVMCEDFRAENEFMNRERHSLEAMNCVMCTTSNVGFEVR